jgi:transcriptional regulator with XRE-family HTH domain
MIQAWREKNHLSRRTLATSIGIDHVTLARLENNDVRSITMENLNKILVWISKPQKP